MLSSTTTNSFPTSVSNSKSFNLQLLHATQDGSEISLALIWTNYMLLETRWLQSDVYSTFNVRWRLQVLLGVQEDSFKLVMYFPTTTTTTSSSSSSSSFASSFASSMENEFYLDTRFQVCVYEEEATPLLFHRVQYTGSVREFFPIKEIPLMPILPLLRKRNETTTLIFKFHFTHVFQFASSSLLVFNSITSSSLALFLNHSPTSDCCFQIENQLIHAHKLILSQQSNFFQTMFQSGFKESFDDPLIFSEWNLNSFVLCLLHIYLGWLPHEPISNKVIQAFPFLHSTTLPFPLKDASSWIETGSFARMLGLHRFAYYAFQHAHDILSKELMNVKYEVIKESKLIQSSD